jgi:hypothetical protein
MQRVPSNIRRLPQSKAIRRLQRANSRSNQNGRPGILTPAFFIAAKHHNEHVLLVTLLKAVLAQRLGNHGESE